MWFEKLLWWFAMACAVLLVPSWLNPKTVHVHNGGGQAIQGWGWQNVASWMGAFAIVALCTGRFTRSRVPIAMFAAAVAAAAFGIAAAEASRTWIDLTKEAANPELYGWGRAYELRPATGMDGVIVIALAGAAFTLVLLGAWPRAGEDEW